MFEVPDMEDPATLSIIVPSSSCVVPLHVGVPVIIQGLITYYIHTTYR